MKTANHLRPPGLTHCKRCGKELTYVQRVHNKNQYCSRECGQGKPVPICRCETCGRTFRPIGNDRLRYCTRRCADIDYSGRTLKDHWPGKSCRVCFKECKECGKMFTTHGTSLLSKRNCSDKCKDKCKQDVYLKYLDSQQYKEYRATQRIKYRIESDIQLMRRDCILCGNKFETFRDRQLCCSTRCGNRYAKQQRRARMQGVFIENVSLRVVFKRDGGCCQGCGRKLNLKRTVPHPLAATRDHIKPISFGGLHEYKNVQLLCFMCNSTKGNR
ncbi:hypothetical protein LCGC14_1959530, partial [marine sediment metagenome]